jgi:hypothetical protein
MDAAGPEKNHSGSMPAVRNTEVGVPQGSQQHPAMQIRNIMVQGADFRVSRLYETRKPKTIHVVAQVADVLQQQSLHVRSRIGDSFC